MGDGVGEHLLHFAFLADIRFQRDSLAPARLNHLRHPVSRVRVGNIIDDDRRPGSAEGDGAGFADARTRARDQRLLIFERPKRIHRNTHDKFQAQRYFQEPAAASNFPSVHPQNPGTELAR